MKNNNTTKFPKTVTSVAEEIFSMWSVVQIMNNQSEQGYISTQQQ